MREGTGPRLGVIVGNARAKPGVEAEPRVVPSRGRREATGGKRTLAWDGIPSPS